jgi:chemotaxis protein methyltransferase CheR
VKRLAEQLAALVRQRTGIKTGEQQLSSLLAAAERTAPGTQPLQLLEALHRGDRELWERLIDEVTINETFFFRHVSDLLAVDWHVLWTAARRAGSDSVRVWVAGCASGEEAYTLAILAAEAFAPAPAPVSILATDISTSALQKAERARYGTRSVRGVAPELRTRYFAAHGKELQVDQQIRTMVKLARHNLVRDPVPPGGVDSFELITCRNTLIYFDPPTVDGVIASLQAALSPGGKLVLGAADRISGSTKVLRRRSRMPKPSAPSGKRRRERSTPQFVAPSPVEGLAEAVSAANAGELDAAIRIATAVVSGDPLNAEALIVRGLAELSAQNAPAAVSSFRHALYVRPGNALAAFHLGRALERCGDRAAAARSYRQALRIMNGTGTDEAVSVGDIEAACAMRLSELRRSVEDAA